MTLVVNLVRTVSRHRENRQTISIVTPQLLICPYFDWLMTFRCVCDVTSATRIASTTANKLRWSLRITTQLKSGNVDKIAGIFTKRIWQPWDIACTEKMSFHRFQEFIYFLLRNIRSEN